MFWIMLAVGRCFWWYESQQASATNNSSQGLANMQLCVVLVLMQVLALLLPGQRWPPPAASGWLLHG
jgi:hypothetical protein